MILVTVTGTYKQPDGTAARGHVAFTPAPVIVADNSTQDLVVADTLTAALDSTGTFTVQLMSSTDTNLSPNGWTYTVQETIFGVAPRTYSVDIAGPGPVNLFTLAPVPQVLGALRLVPGPQGPAGAAGATGATGPQGPPGPASVGRMIFQGMIDASTSPNYPAATKGDTYDISVDGHIGGAAGPTVLKNDTLIAIADTAAGDHATVGANWDRNGDRKSPLVTTFLSGTGNYTIPTGATQLRVQMLGAGSGGGSGRRGAAGTVRSGGGGGAGGFFIDVILPVADVLVAYPTGVIPYTVAAGSNGGAAITTDDTNGNPGSAAGSTIFGTGGNLLIALSGSAGSGGTATGAAGGSMPSNPGATGAAANTAGGPGITTPQSPLYAAPGGPSGAGITTANAASNGAAGRIGMAQTTTGFGGVVAGASPSSGLIPATLVGGPAPGSGASSTTTAAQAGANAAANSGAGGAGGGASLNGNASGAGGAGGSGFIRITAYR